METTDGCKAGATSGASTRPFRHFASRRTLAFVLFGAICVLAAGGCSPRVVIKPVELTGKTSVATTKGTISVAKAVIGALIPDRLTGRQKVQTGIASWYGKEYHGRRTANGEIYNMHALTAAHKHLDFNTRVRVTNLSNDRTVVVRINDRGPFKRGRIIDLSYGAARKLDMVEAGIQKVRLEVLR